MRGRRRSTHRRRSYGIRFSLLWINNDVCTRTDKFSLYLTENISSLTRNEGDLASGFLRRISPGVLRSETTTSGSLNEKLQKRKTKWIHIDVLFAQGTKITREGIRTVNAIRSLTSTRSIVTVSPRISSTLKSTSNRLFKSIRAINGGIYRLLSALCSSSISQGSVSIHNE